MIPGNPLDHSPYRQGVFNAAKASLKALWSHEIYGDRERHGWYFYGGGGDKFNLDTSEIIIDLSDDGADW